MLTTGIRRRDLGGGALRGGGERIPDPVKGLSHAATVKQVCRFYYMQATGRMIIPERSQQMLEIFSTLGLHDKFVSMMEKSVPLDGYTGSPVNGACDAPIPCWSGPRTDRDISWRPWLEDK